jgi:hypothetical protein
MSEPQLQVVACRPKDVTELMKFMPAGHEEPHFYTGSIEGVCGICGDEIWIGPKVQEHLATNKALVACFFCAAKTVSDLSEEATFESRDLGNTEFG